MSRNRRHRSARRASAVKSTCGDDTVLVAIASLVGKQVPRFVFAEHRSIRNAITAAIYEFATHRLLMCFFAVTIVDGAVRLPHVLCRAPSTGCSKKARSEPRDSVTALVRGSRLASRDFICRLRWKTKRCDSVNRRAEPKLRVDGKVSAHDF